jgi:hypothetical protein
MSLSSNLSTVADTGASMLMGTKYGAIFTLESLTSSTSKSSSLSSLLSSTPMSLSSSLSSLSSNCSSYDHVELCLVSDPLKKPIIIAQNNIFSFVKCLYLALDKATHYYFYGDSVLASYSIDCFSPLTSPLSPPPPQQQQQQQRSIHLKCIVFQIHGEIIIYIGKLPFKEVCRHQQQKLSFPMPLDKVQFTCCELHNKYPKSFDKGFCSKMTPVGYRLKPLKDNVYKLCEKIYSLTMIYGIEDEENRGRIVKNYSKTLKELWSSTSSAATTTATAGAK